VGQLIWCWAHELGFDSGEPDPDVLEELDRSAFSELELLRWVEYIRTNINSTECGALAQLLRQLEFACVLLFKLDALHAPKDSAKGGEQRAKKALEIPPRRFFQKLSSCSTRLIQTLISISTATPYSSIWSEIPSAPTCWITQGGTLPFLGCVQILTTE